MGRLSLFLASALVLLVGLSAPPAAAQQNQRGKTMTSWDCCKPSCAWPGFLKDARASGSVKVCDKNDNPFAAARGQTEGTSCDKDKPGAGFLCSDYAPRPLSDDLSYAFVVTNGSENCCRCYEMEWSDGPARGKRLQVQVINNGGKVDAQQGREFMIVSPGGGVGPNQGGCNQQYGMDWGRQYGGVVKGEDCITLPDRLQGGCYWRFNWAKGDINGWPVTYSSIQCPDYHTKISGCTPPR